MRTALLGCVVTFLLACGPSTSGAKCGEGKKEVDSKCVVDGAGGGMGDGGTAGASGGVVEHGAGGSSDAGGAPVGGGGEGVGGGGGGGGEPVDIGPTGEPLHWGDDGYISASENDEGIGAQWWFMDDCVSAGDLPCLERDESLTGPDGESGWSVTGDTVCVKGRNDNVTDSLKQWGGFFGFSFALPDGSLVPYDASAYRGIAVDITGNAPMKTQITLDVQDEGPLYFQWFPIPTTDAVVFFEGPEAPIQPGADPVPLDPSRLASVGFVIVPYPEVFDFCVGNIRLVE